MRSNGATPEAQNAPNAWNTFLIGLRYNEGQIIKLAGNNPIFLNNSEYVWFVYTGKADVFISHIENGVPTGSRTHLFRVTDRFALFGMNLLDRSIGLMAGGAQGTQLLRVSKAKLEEAANDGEFAAWFAVVMDNWITLLSSVMPSELPPRDHEPLEPENEITLQENQIAYPQRGVVWVKHLTGSSRVAGTVNVSLQEADNLFPISTHIWLQSVGESKLRVIDTETALRKADAWIYLERFHNVVLNFLNANMAQKEAVESKRLENKVEADSRRMKDAFSHLASILYPEARSTDLNGGQDPLLTACKLVGNAQNIIIRAHPGALKQVSQHRALQNIVAASRIRLRKVALRNQWWKDDNGPMVAFLGEEKHPVALLPTSEHSYVLHNPVSGTLAPVNALLASQLDFHAVSFYRPFPDRNLNVLDLVKFGLHACRPDAIMLIVMGVLVGLLGIAPPIAIGAIFDTIIPGAQQSLLLQIAAILLIVALSTAAFQITRDIAVLRIEGKMESVLQAATIDRLLDLPPRFFRSYTSGDLGLRALGIGTIRQTLSRVAISAILSGFFSIFNLVLLFFYSSTLAVASIGLVLFLIVVVVTAGYIQIRFERELGTIEGRISGTVLQFITGIAKFRVAGAEQRAFAFWAQLFADQKRLAYKARTIANRLAIFNAVFPIIATMVVFWLMVSGANRLSIGSFLAFNAAFLQLLTNAITLGSAFTAVLQVVPTYERVKPLLQTLPEVDQTKADPGELGGSIEVSHVSFRYAEKGPLVLNDVTLSIDPNQFVAFVGPSGSGKSTILRLLLGFEKPESGSILYDGHDLSGLDVRSVRRQIGVVLQSGKLMTADIYTNIVGSSGLTIDDALEAARLAGLDEDLKYMPMGLQTLVSEGGSTFSGGQRQRLLIARAIANKPRMIFFDEATSALDNRTQEIISKSLENLAATKVVIAHRLSTIIKADQIFVVEKGQIVQSGTYQELMNQPGLFAELAKRQIA
jgi:NHLM bacteriocin system ABC transporter ATP-binding protein